MATFVRGYTFGASEQVTNSKLNSLADSAGIFNSVQSDLVASEGYIHVGPTSPSDTDQLWIDTVQTPYILKLYDGSNWVSVNEYGRLTNQTGQAAGAGRVVILDTANDNGFKFTSTKADTSVLGVPLKQITSTSADIIASIGNNIVVRTEVSASAGTFLRTASSTGVAAVAQSFSKGVFAILTVSANASGAARIIGPGNGVDVLDDNTWTGTQTFSGNVSLNGVTTLTTASASETNWKGIVQVVSSVLSTSASGNTAIPLDDSTPLSNEGTQFMTATITPKSAANTLLVKVVGCFSQGGGTAVNIFALFSNIGSATASAIAAIIDRFNTADAINPISFTTYLTAGTASATTFSLRAGNNPGNNIAINSINGARILGGSMISSITITEIAG